ncbi:MAG TPA: asparagine synthase (glutamine-hydrolyzing), partial [Phycisphaerae bacterium]|nr:asparagine synthase (glutamine-hydrolyzing) [Phycisphaerae bacterium]
EIYNFPSLRRRLEARGHVFRTRSDTEVIVHGYREWGVDVLDHLNGMFGLAVWDEARRQLMLARDPMGIKTLYYHNDSGVLRFGSELRALLAADGVAREVDPDALNLFLRYRYTPAPLTVLKGIRKLAPGTRLIVHNGAVRLERWWNYRPEPFDPMPSVKDAEDKLLDLYTEAVKRQLMSDVPLGLLLSGGVDSGLLLALMSTRGQGWKTYTVGYGRSFKDDELHEAAETARILDAENIAVCLDRASFESTLPRVATVLEEPVASASVVPMYHVCERARRDVKVALMGQGPDELFGGYKRHLGVRYGVYWRRLPRTARSIARRVLSALPRNEAIKRALYSLDVPDRIQRYKEVFSIMPGHEIDGLFRDGAVSPGCGEKILDCWKDLLPLMDGTDELGGLQFLEVRSSLPDELLMYADKISMAHSLEVRVPYLDLEIVRFVERLSAAFKVRRASRKWLHTRVCRNFLPARITRRKKRGFAANVVDGWYRSALEGQMENMLRDSRSRMYDYLCPERVQHLLHDHLNGRCDNHKILFSLVVLEEWLRNFASS